MAMLVNIILSSLLCGLAALVASQPTAPKLAARQLIVLNETALFAGRPRENFRRGFMSSPSNMTRLVGHVARSSVVDWENETDYMRHMHKRDTGTLMLKRHSMNSTSVMHRRNETGALFKRGTNATSMMNRRSANTMMVMDKRSLNATTMMKRSANATSSMKVKRSPDMMTDKRSLIATMMKRSANATISMYRRNDTSPLLKRSLNTTGPLYRRANLTSSMYKRNETAPLMFKRDVNATMTMYKRNETSPHLLRRSTNATIMYKRDDSKTTHLKAMDQQGTSHHHRLRSAQQAPFPIANKEPESRWRPSKTSEARYRAGGGHLISRRGQQWQWRERGESLSRLDEREAHAAESLDTGSRLEERALCSCPEADDAALILERREESKELSMTPTRVPKTNKEPVSLCGLCPGYGY
ncbi:hypothetical protein GQ602_004700 [Ophiocordyceps camponoti-floridani]|uniref:Uncharacterized protein n=1 Tax=Ophiocordyceps camponoti-floridani TaxID=2030778 RepID=A0A8H4Q4B0_9HYPO|nr:hypothetical protein GQ602_004700 [Ophiocordyceps camponoti-floridani]